jgi:phospholipid/cholesterol/gamma-HCH transport system permease protein
MTAVTTQVGKSFANVGKSAVGVFGEAGQQLRFHLKILYYTVTHLIIRRKYARVVFNLVSDIAIGVGALVVGGGMVFVIFTMSFFTGTEVGLQGFKGLEQLGAESFTGLVGSWANTREVTPIIAGIAFAAQVGAGFTAELGAMRISEEIDALEVMSVPSFVYLVCTRVLAALISIIPLFLMSLYASFFATELVTTKFFGLSQGIYDHYFKLYLPAIDIFYSLAKASIFAIAVALIHCYYGYFASGGPEGVGRAVGRAIRLSIITVVILNLLLSLFFWGGHNTIKIAG